MCKGCKCGKKKRTRWDWPSIPAIMTYDQYMAAMNNWSSAGADYITDAISSEYDECTDEDLIKSMEFVSDLEQFYNLTEEEKQMSTKSAKKDSHLWVGGVTQRDILNSNGGSKEDSPYFKSKSARQAEVMIAHSDGKQIQVYDRDQKIWYDIKYPAWDWSKYNYRVKPEDPIPATEEELKYIDDNTFIPIKLKTGGKIDWVPKKVINSNYDEDYKKDLIESYYFYSFENNGWVDWTDK